MGEGGVPRGVDVMCQREGSRVVEFKRADFKCDWGSQLDIIGIYGLGDKRNAEAPLCRRRSEIGQHTPASETTTTKRYHEILPKQNNPRLSRIPTSHTKPKKNPPVPRLKYGRDGGRGGEGVVSDDTASVSMPNGRQPFHLHDDNRQPTLDHKNPTPARRTKTSKLCFPHAPLHCRRRHRARARAYLQMQRRSRGGMGHASEPRWGVPLPPPPLQVRPVGTVEEKRDRHPTLSRGLHWHSKRACLQRR